MDPCARRPNENDIVGSSLTLDEVRGSEHAVEVAQFLLMCAAPDALAQDTRTTPQRKTAPAVSPLRTRAVRSGPPLRTLLPCIFPSQSCEFQREILAIFEILIENSRAHHFHLCVSSVISTCGTSSMATRLEPASVRDAEQGLCVLRAHACAARSVSSVKCVCALPPTVCVRACARWWMRSASASGAVSSGSCASLPT